MSEPLLDGQPHTAARPGVTPQPPRSSLFGWLMAVIDAVPALLTFALLAGVAYWGHHTGWKMPSFSALNGHAEKKEDDWCAEHGVPESQCVECDPALLPRPKAHGWCKTHGVSDCPLCNPELAQVVGTPRLPAYDTVAALNLIDRPANNPKCNLYRRRVQFASLDSVNKAGIDVDVVGERPMIDAIEANGEIGYDPTTVARLSTRAPGAVWLVRKSVGDKVKAGEVLALVDAAEVGRAKTEYAQAVVQVRLKAQTYESVKSASGAVPERRIREAEAEVSDAKLRVVTAEQVLANLGMPVTEGWGKLEAKQLADKLRFHGLPADLAEEAAKKTTSANLFPVRASQAGTVVKADVVAGEVVDNSKVLFVVADLGRMWLTMHLRQEDARLVKVGQKVRFGTDAAREEVAGTVAWVSPEVDEKTRTQAVRVNLDNPDGRLKANTFGTGRVVLREEPKAVSVPKEALQSEGCCNVVFVRDKGFMRPDAPKVFHTRQVRPGAKDETHVELLAGVLPGEVVVTRGSAVLRAELLRTKLGAG